MENSGSNEILRNTQATLPPVDDWYAHRDVLITGASGFLGRVLIEKLLRSCPHIGTIYMLLRPKKGQQPQDRLHDLINVTLFNRLRKSNPDALKKLRVVSGDVAAKGLNLSAEDATMLEERISVVFHMAATVRFDEPLNKCILLNTRGTREICELAKRMRKLQCFVHVSTAYSNSDRPIVDEQMYPPPTDWKRFVQIAENTDEYVTDVLSKKILGNFANTYVFSKSLAENVLLDYQHDLPIVLMRPSIIICPAWDPFPGWTDNAYGPISLCLVTLKGIVHVLPADSTNTADFVPADILVKGLIISTVKKAVLDKPNDIVIYNGTTHDNYYISYQTFQNLSIRLVREQSAVSYSNPVFFMVRNMRLAKFFILLFDFVYVGFLDVLLRLMREKQSILRILRMSVVGMTMTYFFATTPFELKNGNFNDLNKYVHPSDKENFTFDFKCVCFNNLARHLFYTYRKSFFKEKKFNNNIIRFWADVIVAVVAIIFLYFLWSKGVHTFALGLVGRVVKFAFLV